ncbi:Uncharacterised protein [Legionella lansingensis]|uniref:DUF5638 domain-containing protein n=1 Tax=Legionella lansingensis TaxID=45067 RepID=A0A0W0VEH3_9GAMM|nr:hypothetical protein [Legionella lansingensis]KTD18532.1 hypothetical protein Llan_2519 [Legionella lansingensis]SNV50953.1 Uncharacterised protein [Legionella lansingensis]
MISFFEDKYTWEFERITSRLITLKTTLSKTAQQNKLANKYYKYAERDIDDVIDFYRRLLIRKNQMWIKNQMVSEYGKLAGILENLAYDPESFSKTPENDFHSSLPLIEKLCHSIALVVWSLVFAGTALAGASLLALPGAVGFSILISFTLLYSASKIYSHHNQLFDRNDDSPYMPETEARSLFFNIQNIYMAKKDSNFVPKKLESDYRMDPSTIFLGKKFSYSRPIIGDDEELLLEERKKVTFV